MQCYYKMQKDLVWGVSLYVHLTTFAIAASEIIQMKIYVTLHVKTRINHCFL